MTMPRALCLTIAMIMVSASTYLTSAFSMVAPIQCRTTISTTIQLRFSSSDKGDEAAQREQEVVFVEPGSESDALSDDLWEEIEGAQPPKWIVMKEIMGIGGFTYLLAALIVGMLSMNAILGPGWLGQAIGIQGTGSFTETSPTLPDQIDLSADNFLF